MQDTVNSLSTYSQQTYKTLITRVSVQGGHVAVIPLIQKITKPHQVYVSLHLTTYL